MDGAYKFPSLSLNKPLEIYLLYLSHNTSIDLLAQNAVAAPQPRSSEQPAISISDSKSRALVLNTVAGPAGRRTGPRTADFRRLMLASAELTGGHQSSVKPKSFRSK